LGTQDTNRQGPGNLGYTRYKQTLAWVCILCTQCCQSRVCFYLVYTMLPGHSLFLSCVPNVARSVSIFILCSQCCQGSVYILSCVLNVARSVSVFILCTQCCQARVCLYFVYPMLPGQCLFVSCGPNFARPVSVCIV
jgi:hypothetical protein